MADDLPMAFNVEAVRQELLRGIRIPAEMVNDGLAELHRQISAKTTKHFTYRGKVIEKRDVADNGARLQAIDQTLSLAGPFKPDDRRSGGSSSPNFAIEVTKEGVIRIAVGSPGSLNPASTPAVIDIPRESTAIPHTSGHQALVSEKVKSSEDTVARFNTILDELVDE